jgi:Mg-chelatase subunit ChlD
MRCTFVAALPAKDSLAVMTFADRPKLVQDLSPDRAAAIAAIGKYQSNGGTALYDAIAESALRLEQVDGRRAIVVLTDGRDENNPGTAPGSVRTLADTSALVKETSSTVFAIGLGAKVDRQTLEFLAQLSGGEAYFPDVSAGRRRVLRPASPFRDPLHIDQQAR